MSDMACDLSEVLHRLDLLPTVGEDVAEAMRAEERKKMDRESWLSACVACGMPRSIVKLFSDRSVRKDLLLPQVYTPASSPAFFLDPQKGKTVSACAWLSSQYRKGKSMRYVTASDVHTLYAKGGWNNPLTEQMIRKLESCGALVIDNIDLVPFSTASTYGFSVIIKKRSDEGRLTLCLGNGSTTLTDFLNK